MATFKIKTTIHLKDDEEIKVKLARMKSDVDYYYKEIFTNAVNPYIYGSYINTKPVSTIDIKSTEKKIKEMIKDTESSH